MGGCGLLQPPDKRGRAMLLGHRTRSTNPIDHFAYYLYGRNFVAYTDHKPLCQLLTSNRLNPRLRKLSMKLQHRLVKVEYVPRRENGSPTLSQARNGQGWHSKTRLWTPVSPRGMYGHQPPARETLQRGVPRQEIRTRENNH